MNFRLAFDPRPPVPFSVCGFSRVVPWRYNLFCSYTIYPSKVPSQDKYISISVDREERANLTVTLVRTTNHTEVVFSYSRAQVVKTSSHKIEVGKLILRWCQATTTTFSGSMLTHLLCTDKTTFTVWMVIVSIGLGKYHQQ